MLPRTQDELNRFPISIGTDDLQHENPDWETILHPGTEALMAIKNGESYLRKTKKNLTPAELAQVLSGDKLSQDNDNTNSDNSEGSGVDEGYMRVPKFWDPPVYRVIADERERRGETPAKHI